MPSRALLQIHCVPRWVSCALAVLGLLVAALPAAAHLVPVGPEIRVTATGEPERPALAAAPDGGVVVAWSDAVSRRVEVRRFDGVGRPVGHAQTLSVRGEAPAVAVGPAGEAVVAWRQLVAGGVVLLARRVDSYGLPRGELIRLAEPSPGVDSGPMLALAPDGGFAVAWGERTAAGAELRLRLFAATGTAAGPAFAVSDHPGARPRLGGLTRAADRWVVAWEEAAGADGAGVVAQRAFSADGVPLGGGERLAGAQGGDAAPSVAALADGSWAAAWLHLDPPLPAARPGRLSVATRLLSAEGAETPLLAVAPVLGPPALADAATTVTPLAGGGWLVTWSGVDADGTARLAGRAFDATGTPAGGAFAIPRGDGGAGQPAAAALAGGGAAVAWRVPAGTDAPGEIRWRRLESPCVGAAATLCLADGRFRARVTYADRFGGGGDGVALPRGEHWGSFWFFRPSNVELAVKVLDARAASGNFWVFYASLTDAAFTLSVVDVETGNRRVYTNPGGTLASRGDTAALPGGDTAPRRAAPRPAAPGIGNAGDLPDLRPTLVPLPEADDAAGCRPAPDRLCLGAGGRFAVEATWHDFGRGQGAAGALPQTTDTGALWFFRPGNPELIVKVLDGRNVNGSFWVFYGALTNVAFDLVVRDTVTGQVVRYENPLGTFASRGDTGAFGPR